MPNLYATLQEFKDFATSRGQTATTSTTDDAVILHLLGSASRYIEGKTARQFYPTVQARVYDVPEGSTLFLSGDLLEALTVTNGDATTVTSTYYILVNPNSTPYRAIALKTSSGLVWQGTSSGDTRQALTINAIWGYRENYSTEGWKSVGTLGAAMTDTTTLTFTMTAGHTVTAQSILRIDNELFNVSSVATNTITAEKRGDNGSTAATHTSGTTVYAWQPDTRAKQATLEKVLMDYDARFGRNDTAPSPENALPTLFELVEAMRVKYLL